jgi:ATP-binding protein involved in chromosome partitioning
VFGIVENMSIHVCSECGHEEHIFGSGGGAQMAEQYGVDLLGSLPLDISIREGVDNGRPTVAMDADSRLTAIYRDIARKTAAKLSLQAKDYSSKFPKIVVENA